MSGILKEIEQNFGHKHLVPQKGIILFFDGKQFCEGRFFNVIPFIGMSKWYAMGCWFSKKLGDGMWAWESIDELKDFFLLEYVQAGNPKEMAVFTRHESEGRLHCELIAYFSPASVVVAKKFTAEPCVRPIPAGLNLLAGSKDSWSALFPEHSHQDLLGLFWPSFHRPLPLTDPFKMIANIAAIALLDGIWILQDNQIKLEQRGKADITFYDWFLIWEITAVGVTGLGAELLR